MKYWALGAHTNPFVMEKQSVVDLIERSSMTPESLCRGPELEGAKPKSNGARESTNEELPVTKGEALFKLLQDLEME